MCSASCTGFQDHPKWLDCIATFPKNYLKSGQGSSVLFLYIQQIFFFMQKYAGLAKKPKRMPCILSVEDRLVLDVCLWH